MTIARGIATEYRQIERYSIEEYLTHIRWIIKQSDKNGS